MSILTASSDDFERRNGQAIPAGVYRVTVESAGPEAAGNGTQFKRQYGNLRTRDGATEFQHNGGMFRLGNRKLFARSWIEHTNPKAVDAGRAQIIREAAAAGIIQKPAKGAKVELDFSDWGEYANRLAGAELMVRIGHETRRNRVTKQVELDDEGNPKVDERVLDWVAP